MELLRLLYKETQPISFKEIHERLGTKYSMACLSDSLQELLIYRLVEKKVAEKVSYTITDKGKRVFEKMEELKKILEEQ
jgi:DNA-binding HxlR family transcriptional regulator